MAAGNGGDLHAAVGLASAEHAAGLDVRELRLFLALDRGRQGYVHKRDLVEILEEVGLDAGDPRLRESMGALAAYGTADPIHYLDFCRIVRPNILLLERVLQGNLVIPDFEAFRRDLGAIYERTLALRTGDVARYIPQLAKVDPEQYAVAVCTVDGQRMTLGDARTSFCLQSCCKPVNYCLALEEHGEDHVHRFVGREPSGHGFNELRLNSEGKPHNPMINAGAIMCLSLIRAGADIADRFEHVMDRWQALAGGQRPGFSNAVYLSERQTADRNFALGYFMREHKAFPPGADLVQTLEFYFQCCSIEATAELMAAVAATLANGGECPVTGERVLAPRTVQNCLSLMYSCGMYDFSGEFSFSIGLPAKSGVSGALMVVVPNTLGLCVWSPRIDTHGNSVRGVAFSKELVRTFNFHNYDNLSGLTEKIDPRLGRIQAEARKVDELIWAASKGDLGAVQRLITRGAAPDGADYDGRTALHLAAAEGRTAVVEYLAELAERGAAPGAGAAALSPRDRWGGTPLDDALVHGRDDVARLLAARGALRGEVAASPAAGGAERHPQSAVDPGRVVELIWAAAKGQLRAIQRLVARGVDLRVADYDRRTALHLAAAEGHLHVVEYFVRQGVDLGPRDRWGGTPLGDALRHGHERVVELLLAHGAPP
jgi:glutaminase